MVTGGNYAYHGEHFIMYKTVESLCCTPAANIMCVNCTTIKIKKIKEKNLPTS